jgi:hypothetical protein
MNSEQNEYSASSVYDYPFSFSGTDVEAYIIQGNYSYKLNSLSTVSFQVNEQKSPVRRLGYVSPVGFTRAIRTIAGTLVLTVLKDHPFSIIKDAKRNTLNLSSYIGLTSFLGENKVVQNQEFDLLLKYQSEGNRRFYSQFRIKGINLISQSMVTSVNDMVTEMVFQFMAKDFDDFKLIEDEAQKQEFNKVKEAITKDNINQLIAKLEKEIETLKALITANSFSTEGDKKTAEENLKTKKEQLEKLKQDLEKIQKEGEK